MKHILIVSLFLILYSCNNSSNKYIASQSDSLDGKSKSEWVDSAVQSLKKNVLFDTVGLWSAPVKVLKSRLVKREYSNYKDISITYKNMSNKDISAIRFKWYGENAFGDPADMGSAGLQQGFGGGFDDDGLGAGETTTSQWSILSNNAKRVVLAWPCEIVFEDGTKWKSSNK